MHEQVHLLDQRQEVAAGQPLPMSADLPGRERLSLAALIDRLSAGVARRDEAYARELAQRLQQAADRIELEVVQTLGLRDVVATFSMDKVMRLVVTGWLDEGVGEVTVRYREKDFGRVQVLLLAQPGASDTTWCTLDFSYRGRPARLLSAVEEVAVGAVVTIRALSTVGPVKQWRTRWQQREVSVPLEALVLIDGGVE